MSENMLKADRATNQEIQDYRDMLAPREAPLDDNKSNSIPELKPYVADTSGSLKPMPLVSIAINQSIPLRDALFELAKQADYDIQLDPRIKGSIIYTARNKPFDTVISQISELAGLRYKFDDGAIKVELDTPFTKNYKIEYLAFTRSSKSSMDTSTKVESGDNSSSSSTGSSFGITSDAKTDFWGELDTNIKQILEANSQLNYQITAADPELSISGGGAAVPPVPPVDEGALSAEPQAGEEKRSSLVSTYSAGQSVPQVPLNSDEQVSQGVPDDSADGTALPTDGSAAPAVPDQSGGAGATSAVPQPVQLSVNSLPSVSTGEGGASYQPSYSINKQAGLVSVYGTQKAHDQIASYLDLMRKAVTSQVLIEAKVLEVELSDEFSYGIDWTALTHDNGFGALVSIPVGALNPTAANTFVLRNDVRNFVTAIQRFGTVHALASPRLTVLNNQAAVLNVAENQVYFELKANRETDPTTGLSNLTIDSSIKNVPEGVLVNVLPSIDADRNSVSMQVRPTISRITGFVDDPSVTLILASVGLSDSGIASSIPIVSTKEIDTVLNMGSGQTIVMGGLLEDRTESSQRAVPVLGEVPIIGAAFRGQTDSIQKNELVILIKSTIINQSEESVHNTDRDLYRVYSQDRRPFKL